jgi:hypothetical protein
MSAPIRKSSRAEIAFLLLRTLVAGRALWGAAGALSIASLCAVLHANPRQLAGALHYLSDEGLIMVDRREGLVRLTDRGLRDLTA